MCGGRSMGSAPTPEEAMAEQRAAALAFLRRFAARRVVGFIVEALYAENALHSREPLWLRGFGDVLSDRAGELVWSGQ